MAIEDLRVIGNVLYERRPDGLLYPVRQVAGQTPAQSQPQAPQGLLSGIPELGRMVNTLGTFNQMFNPVEGIGQSMDASRRMVAPDTSTMDRLAALGDMLSGVAGVTAPIGAAVRAGTPAAVALMEGLLGGSPTVTAARDTARAAGRGFVERMNQPGPVPVMGSNFANLLGDVGEASTGIRAYQGSPHNFAAERLVRMPDGSTQYIVGAPDVLPNVPAGAEVLRDFPLGRMRMDKLGTGEGAQAFGSGLYTAENEGIARHYRDMLATPGTASLITRASPDAHIPHGSKIREIAASLGDGLGQTPEEFKSSIVNRLRTPSENAGQYEREQLNMIADELEAGLWDVKPSTMGDKGSMYEVNINADPKAFLDWDKPLGQQPESVRSAFSSLGTPERLAPVMGENAYRALEGQSGSIDWPVGASLAERNAARKTAAENARQKLLDAGIPGVKYSDASSRDKAYTVNLAYKGRPFEQGQFEPQFARSKEEADSIAKQYQGKGYDTKIEESGTRNYVVFDENLISIVRKYGIAGAAAMLGVSALDVEEAMARGQPSQGLLSMGSK